MENEQTQQPVNQTNEQGEDLIQYYQNVIADLKTKSVPVERYEKLEKTHKEFVQAYANGEQIAAASSMPQKKSSKEICMEMANPEKPLTNIEYIEKSLAYRDALLEETGEDCFVSKGHTLNLSAESYASAQRTADIYRECLDYANGDNQAFTNELLRRMVDSPLANMKNSNKNRR